MIPANRTGTTKTIIGSLSSRQLSLISIAGSLILVIFCIIGDVHSALGLAINGIYFIVNIIALPEAIKRRCQENEGQYQSRANKDNPYKNVPTNRDLYFAAIIALSSVALLMVKTGMLLVGAYFFIFVIAIFFFGITPAFGNSMLPKIGFGDLVIMEQWFFFRRTIKRGDIISFAAPPGLKLDWAQLFRRKKGAPFVPALLKRVIALPGETVSVTNGKVYINGKHLEEDKNIPPALYEVNCLGGLGDHQYKPYADPQLAAKPITVPEGHYFVLGDFRINENMDSHVFGFVPEKQVLGRLIMTLPFGVWDIKIKRRDFYTLGKHILAARKFIQDKKFEEAVEECNKAIAFYDQCAPAFTYRALAKRKLKQFEEGLDDSNQAINLYKRTKELLPGLWESIGLAYTARAVVYIDLQKYKEALNDLNKAIELTPDRGDFWYHRGQAHKALGDNRLADKDLAQASELGYVS